MKVTAALAAVAALPLISAAPSAEPTFNRGPNTKYPGLDVLAKKAGLLYFGTAIDNVVLNNSRYVQIAHNRSEFGQVTPANGQKWMFIEPQRGVFNFSMANEIVRPAIKAGQMRRCHNLVWHSQLPDWVNNGQFSKKEWISILENHIKHEAGYYYDTCYAWDVVNEAFNDNGTLRETPFLKGIGPEYIELAFKFARKYTSPRTRLYYNDYGIERVNNKSTSVAEMVKDFQKRRVPIDGVGLQAHYTVGRAPTYADQMATIAMFNKLKVEVALTELDVRITLPVTDEKVAQQAVIYADSVKACRDSKDCVGVTVWDFWDPVSWVPYTFPEAGSACLLDDNFVRKPAYYAIADMLRE
jgi:endo-1,4-beta-xylanase